MEQQGEDCPSGSLLANQKNIRHDIATDTLRCISKEIQIHLSYSVLSGQSASLNQIILSVR